MSDRKDAIRRSLETDHAACMAILGSFSDADWGRPAPSESDAPWTARDVLAHLAVSEGGQLGQIQRLLKGEVTVPDDFDLTRFNRRSVQKQAGRSVADFLADIETGYAALLAELERVAEADLDRSGRHARGDVITVEQFFRRAVEHRLLHARQLQQHSPPG